ncbi:MAG: ABC transporter substrate-binding protein [Haloarculaceae archaeon]
MEGPPDPDVRPRPRRPPVALTQPMEIERFPVLAADDEPLVERLAVGLGTAPARVLAYLLARRERDDVDDGPVSLLSVRVGTGLNRSAAREALDALADADLVAQTTLETEGPGRPPTGWALPAAPETVERRVSDRQAEALLDRADAFADWRGDAVEPPDEPADDGATDALALRLNWRPNGLQAPVFAALAADAYAERGLDVSVGHRRGSEKALSAVVDGPADVALVGAATLLRAGDDGAPVVPLALLYQRAAAVIYTTRAAFDGRLERAEQLRGRRVGTPVTSEIGLLGRLFLAQAGVADETTVVDVSGEEQAALRSGRVDAVTGSLSDPEHLRERGATVDAIPVAERFPIYGPAFVARRSTLAADRPAMSAFLAATMAGLADARADPRAAAAAVARAGDRREPADGASGEERPASRAGGDSRRRARRTFADAVETVGRSEAVDAHGWGWHDPDDWERLATVLDRVDVPVDA